MKRQHVLFALFFVSGFCGLLYQTVWLRLALANFGVITPVVSVVVSVFMLGLGLGSFLGGRYISSLCKRFNCSAISFYGLIELIIAAGALAVPMLFQQGRQLLLNAGAADSFAYLLSSAGILCLSILPWTTAMGTTFPFVMAFVDEFSESDKHSFSLLYLANVMGAVLGTWITVYVLIESLGFRSTLGTAAILNGTIGVVSLLWGMKQPKPGSSPDGQANSLPESGLNKRYAGAVLFTTGFISMAMEVIWTRAFTPVLGTVVYSFATLLSIYLICTCFGSYLYRLHFRHNNVKSVELLVAISAVCAVLPVVLTDPRLPGVIHVDEMFLTLFSIAPLCTAFGYLTPLLIDELSLGNPVIAGRCYALNVLGCILGPLAAAYLLLPLMGTKTALLILCAPLLLLIIIAKGDFSKQQRLIYSSVCLALIVAGSFCTSLEEGWSPAPEPMQIRRDYVATVVSKGTGDNKTLLINGIGIVSITPVTKYMAHIPLASLKHKPESALVICFGIGTTFRSLMTWPINVTAVELVPSVRDSFPYYFDNAAEVMRNPKGKVVIDDGRRFLARTKQKFDVITIDPPPPIQAAGSSLLYSKDFYTEIKQHLKPGGILQQWFPKGDEKTLRSVARSLVESFPYVQTYTSVEDWGHHFLCSESPIGPLDAAKIMANMPESAKADLVEWDKDKDKTRALKADVESFIAHGRPLESVLDPDLNIRITDDRPFNEYYLLRGCDMQDASPAKPH